MYVLCCCWCRTSRRLMIQYSLYLSHAHSSVLSPADRISQFNQRFDYRL